jgi:hypothetical protein
VRVIIVSVEIHWPDVFASHDLPWPFQPEQTQKPPEQVPFIDMKSVTGPERLCSERIPC